MKDIRLVALDLDGTVFNDKKEITPRTLAAIRAACARGVAVLPATGRTASGIPAAFTSIPGVRYALTSNGASVVDLTTGEQLVNQPFETEQALKIYDLLEQGGGMMSIFIGGKSYTTRANAENHMDVVPDKELLNKECSPKDYLITTVGCAIGAHTGRGIVGICFFDADNGKFRKYFEE